MQRAFCRSFAFERQAVGALINRGICLMRADSDLVKAAEIAVRTVVCTLMNGAFNAAVEFMTVHKSILLFKILLFSPVRRDLCRKKLPLSAEAASAAVRAASPEAAVSGADMMVSGRTAVAADMMTSRSTAVAA